MTGWNHWAISASICSSSSSSAVLAGLAGTFLLGTLGIAWCWAAAGTRWGPGRRVVGTGAGSSSWLSSSWASSSCNVARTVEDRSLATCEPEPTDTWCIGALNIQSSMRCTWLGRYQGALLLLWPIYYQYPPSSLSMQVLKTNRSIAAWIFHTCSYAILNLGQCAQRFNSANNYAIY